MPQNNPRNRPQDHGGDVYQTGATVLCDFSASINPLGQPEGLLAVIAECWHEVSHYPDRNSAKLLNALADHHNLPVENLAVGNGSAELIDLVLRSSGAKRLLLSPPDFGLYEKFAPASMAVVKIPRVEESGFSVDTNAIRAKMQAGDLILFSNPGNPSGGALPSEEILSLAQEALKAGAFLCVDEAFCDFCPEFSVQDRAAIIPSLAVLRSMTKFYGIPGIRIGYLTAATPLVEAVNALRQPWSVSTLAQAVGVKCLEDEHWSLKTRQYLIRAKDKFLAELKLLPGVTPLPGNANYLLIRLDPPAPDADALYEALREVGTLVRHCGSFGLGSRYVRVAVRTVGENADLIRHLKKLIR